MADTAATTGVSEKAPAVDHTAQGSGTEPASVGSEANPSATPATQAASAPVSAEAVKPVESTTEKPAEIAADKPAEATATTDADKAKVKAQDAATTPTKASSPLQALWETAKSNGHPEIWGVSLADPESHVPSQIIFQKYLNANDGDLAKAKDQLTKTLEWRAKSKPVESLTKKFSKEKFDGLGYVTSYTGPADVKEVFTWNIYGIVKSMEATFGNVEEFIAWRSALMELAMHELSINMATKPITATEDPYKIYQVHDYKSLSFFRQNASVKAASKETIQVISLVYPETLKEKFFVNVPAIMGFMYGVMKLFVAPKTIKKFHPMSNGGALALEFGDSKVEKLGEKLPAAYGGKGEDLLAQGKVIPLE